MLLSKKTMGSLRIIVHCTFLFVMRIYNCEITIDTFILSHLKEQCRKQIHTDTAIETTIIWKSSVYRKRNYNYLLKRHSSDRKREGQKFRITLHIITVADLGGVHTSQLPISPVRFVSPFMGLFFGGEKKLVKN